MSLKQSCFKAVVKSDLKRSWWTSFLATLFMLLVTSVPLLDYVKYGNYPQTYTNFENRIMDRLAVNYFVGMFLAFFLAIVVFGYLNNASSVSFFHGLPMSRNTLLLAHTFSSFVLIAIPVVINTLVCFLALKNGVEVSWLLIGAGLYFVYSLLIYSITLAVVMLTGVSIASAIFTMVVVFLPLFIASFIDELCNTYLYGYASNGDVFDWLVKYVYIGPDSLRSPLVLIYIFATVAFLAIAFFVYNKRHLENYGEVIAFPNLKGLFKVLFGLCSGILGYFYFIAFWGVHSIAVMFAFGALGVIIAHMISNKTFSLKGSLKSFVVTMVCVLLLFVSFKFDLFGYETRVPKLDDVEYVKLETMHTNIDEFIYRDDIGGKNVTRIEYFDPKFELDEDIQLFRRIHVEMIENRNDNGEGTYRLGMYGGFGIEYKLKNGRTMKRSYYLSIDDVKQFVKPIYETDVYRKWQYPVLDGTEKTYTSVSVSDRRNESLHDDTVEIFTGESSQAKKIIAAIIKDRENISFERTLGKKKSSYLSVHLTYTVPCVDENGNPYNAEKIDRYSIDAGDVNTMAVLESIGVLSDESIMTYDDLSGVSFELNSVSVDGNIYYPDGYYEKYEVINGRPTTYVEMVETVQTASSADIKDIDVSFANDSYKYFSVSENPEEVKKIYDMMLDHESVSPINEDIYGSFNITVYYKNSKSFGMTVECSFDELPSFLDDMKKYAKIYG